MPAPPGARVMVSEIPEPRRMVPKLRAVDRLLAAGRGDALLAAFAAAPLVKLRFDAAVEFDAADEQVRAFITAIGADPDAILAP